jgi:hypothetical protein
MSTSGDAGELSDATVWAIFLAWAVASIVFAELSDTTMFALAGCEVRSEQRTQQMQGTKLEEV